MKPRSSRWSSAPPTVIEPITPEIIAEQQDLADMFLELGLIPEKVDVASAVLAVATPTA